MKRSGQIVLASFPYTDLSDTKLRPVLMLRQASVNFDDWLVCMVSSQTQQAEEGLDEIITPADADFPDTGLKAPASSACRASPSSTANCLSAASARSVTNDSCAYGNGWQNGSMRHPDNWSLLKFATTAASII